MGYGVPNMCDYVRCELDSFRERSLTRVDSLVFSWLSYMRLNPDACERVREGGLTLTDLASPQWAEDLCGRTYDPASTWELLSGCAASPRFRDVRVTDYVEDTDEVLARQFAAMTFEMEGIGHYIAFRGTDNTLVGWKEDFNMAFTPEVPSQASAVVYLERIAAASEGDLWVGGHSKGGNLAAYATAMASSECRSRIRRAFSHDGPGFPAQVTQDPRWISAQGLVDKTIPKSSVIGMVFEDQGSPYTVVRSDAVGLFQHDPFSWEVRHRDFVETAFVGLGAQVLDSSVNAWLAASSDQDRERFVDAVFYVLDASGEKTLRGIRQRWQVAVPRMLKAAQDLDAEDRSHILRAVRDVLRQAMPDKDRLSYVGLTMWESMLDRLGRLGGPDA